MSTKKTLPEWLSYIQSLHHSAIDLGLARVVKMAQSLDLCQFSCPVITIGGTNGKGSCVACLESIYTNAGYQVASYTSPHIIHFNERIKLNGQPIDDQRLMQAFSVIEATRKRCNETLSFFEFTTLAALWLFRQQLPDVILLEVGLGGRLDAVNVVDSDLAIITSIALDHMEWLGSNRCAIAAEKTGIARQGRVLICGDETPPENLATCVAKRGADLKLIHKDFTYETNAVDIFWQSGKTRYTLTTPSAIKPQNIATALEAITIMQTKLPVSESAIKTGCQQIKLFGRFEYIASKPPLILDVAHNPAAASWLAKQLDLHYPDKKCVAIFGAMQDKQIDKVIEPFISRIDQWFVVDLPIARAEKATTILSYLNTLGIKRCYNLSSVGSALDKIFDSEKNEPLILVFGSFYTVSEAKQWITKQGELAWN